eukprot:g9750.t1
MLPTFPYTEWAERFHCDGISVGDAFLSVAKILCAVAAFCMHDIYTGELNDSNVEILLGSRSIVEWDPKYAESVFGKLVFAMNLPNSYLEKVLDGWLIERQDHLFKPAFNLFKAQATLEELSGSMEIWTEEVAAKVEELANAFLEGRDLVIRKLKQLAFEAITDLLNCSDGSFLDDLIDKVQNISDRFKNGTRPPRNITDKLCRVSWGSARFLCKIHTEERSLPDKRRRISNGFIGRIDLPEEEMTELSDELAEELSTADLSVRRLAGLARRLAQVTETYVDQDPPK